MFKTETGENLYLYRCMSCFNMSVMNYQQEGFIACKMSVNNMVCGGTVQKVFFTIPDELVNQLLSKKNGLNISNDQLNDKIEEQFGKNLKWKLTIEKE